jgi:hypothetical protein
MVIFALITVLIGIQDTNKINLIDYQLSTHNVFWMIPIETNTYNIFHLLLPIIVSIPCVQFLVYENKMINILISRTSRKSYLRSKMIVFFFSGFSLTFIMMMFHWLFTEIIFHSSQDVYEITKYYITNKKMMSNSFFEVNELFADPVISLLRYVIKTSLWGGILTLSVLAINEFIHRAVSSIIICFVAVFFDIALVPSVEGLIKSLLGLPAVEIFPNLLSFFTAMWYTPNNSCEVVIYLFVLLIVFFLIYAFVHSSRKDVY